MTSLTEPQLIKLREAGRQMGCGHKFVDPTVIYKSMRALDRRGEIWAAKVLGRDISRRSIGVPNRPYLFDGEPEILMLADQAEDDAAFGSIVNA